MSDIANVTTEPKEIEVTPEMVERGLEEFRGFNRDFDDERECVRRILEAALNQ